MRYVLFGAGQMGRAIAFDLLRDPEAEIVIADNDPDQLDDVCSWLDDPRVEPEPIDATNREECRVVMEDMDVAVNALPYRFNLDLSEDAIAAGTHLVDLGGNTAVVERQLELDTAAKEAGIVIIPDCGLAPGLAVLLAADACARLTRVERLSLRVGGLPQKPQGDFDYMLTFNVEGLLNEYSEHCLVVRNGEAQAIEPLTEIEPIRFPEPFGEMECFHTSGGLSTLPRTLGHKVQNMDYKTIRYPGHAAQMRGFFEEGLFSREPRVLEDGTSIVPREQLADLIVQQCDYQEADVVLLRVTAEGLKNNIPLTVRTQIIDRFDKENGITAMMRMTGYPTAIIAAMIARGDVTERGVVPLERSVPADIFRAELAHRDIQLEEMVKAQ
jgi:lysine 6-dehydrogenase